MYKVEIRAALENGQNGDAEVVDLHEAIGMPPFVGADGAQIQELAGRSTGLTSHSLALIRHPAGTASQMHHHTVADEVYLVLSGAGRVQVDDQTRTIRAGDRVEIRPGEKHKVWGDGPDGLALIVTCAPAYQVSEVAWDE
jgi:mannose-6-phosphate isomerase-like protein (cupin superfamily)